MENKNKIYIDAIKKIAGSSKLLKDGPMSRHTTFKTGGTADIYIEAENEETVKKTVDFCRLNNIDYYITGNGSNLLVSDDGFRGLILSTAALKDTLEVNGEYLTCSAGYTLAVAANKAAENGLGGMEFASGIPGSVGGAVFMNAGAYGSEIENILQSVRLLEADGTIRTADACELELSYRSSNIGALSRVILRADFKLKKGDKALISEKMAELNLKRRTKQPLDYPSAGSTFKRPDGYFAGALIEKAGLKGFSIGGAQVSEKHCGFVINKGNATSSDIYNLIKHIQKTVLINSGVELTPEIRLVGKF